MPANVQTMAYYGEVPWHGLGKPVQKGVSQGDCTISYCPKRTCWR